MPNSGRPTTMVAAAASAAPLDTPTSAGSASGLRNRPCMTAPAAASRPPMTSASTMRGSLIDQSTRASRATSVGSPGVRPIAAAMRPGGMPAAPMVAATSAASKTSTSRAGSTSSRIDLRHDGLARDAVTAAAPVIAGKPPPRPYARRGSAREQATDRARRRDRGRRARRAVRSREDRGHPSR